MGRQEQKVKLDQIKVLFEKKEFSQARNICDEIDWSKIKNIKSLFMASDVYKATGNLEEALTCLEHAYDCAPVGKRILYQMADLALEAEQSSRAEEYLEEYETIAPEDPNYLILTYRLGKIKGEATEKLISILKEYLDEEIDEQWSYELAELYAQNQQIEECIELCDYIILWFSVGTYVDKALDLKARYASLTEEQIEKRDNKAKYRARLRQVELEYRSPEDIQVLTNREQREEEEERLASKGLAVSKVKLPSKLKEENKTSEKKKQTKLEEAVKKEPSYIKGKAHSEEMVRERLLQVKENLKQEARKKNEEMLALSQENKVVEPSNLKEETLEEKEFAPDKSDTAPLEEEKSKLVEEQKEEIPEKVLPIEENVTTEEMNTVQKETVETASNRVWHFAIRCFQPEKGYEYALKRLKELAQVSNDYPSAVERTTGMQLNLKSIAEQRERFKNKTVVIEYIGELADERMSELFSLIEEEKGTQLILLDYPDRLERFLRRYPKLTGKLNHIENMKVYDVDTLLAYAQKYADERDYAFHKNAMPVLDGVIKQILMEDNQEPEKKVERYIEKIIQNSEEKSFLQALKNIFLVRYDKENRLVLKKEDLQQVNWKEDV